MIEYHNKITALYSRLSVGDEDRDGGESNSIVNQKAFLERYARDKKLINIRHYIDDDESGRFFDRSAYTQMISDVEQGKIGIVIMKDKESGKYSVFFQAKDMKVMDKAFKHALSESEKKTERKESIHKKIEKFKEMAKNSVSKDKIKNKQKEQSL